MRLRVPKPRFSLLTLFALITALSVFLGGPVQTVRERKEALDWIQERDAAFDLCGASPPGDWNDMWLGYTKDIKVRQARGPSRLCLWMGDRNVDFIGLRSGSVTREQRQEIAALFPEAFVMQQRSHRYSRRDLHKSE